MASSQPIQSANTKRNADEPVSLTWGQSTQANGKTVCYVGGPIWAMEWCPIPTGSPHPQILALTSDREAGPQPGSAITTQGPGLIQFWTMEDNRQNNQSCPPLPILNFVLCHDSGCVRSLAWCPHGGFASQKEGDNLESRKEISFQRLGLLAAACSDSKILVYSIPQPASFLPRPVDQSDQSDAPQKRNQVPFYCPKPITLMLNPSSVQGSPCLSVAWQDGDHCQNILGGFGDGKIVMWNLSSSSRFVRIDAHTLRPVRYFNGHIMAVIALTWSPTLPCQFVSASYEGAILVWDINHPRDPCSTMIKSRRYPTRALCWPGLHNIGFFSVGQQRKSFRKTFNNSRLGFNSNQLHYHGFTKICANRTVFCSQLMWLPGTVWDLTFHPLFDLLVTCDDLGNVAAVLVDMPSFRNKTKTTFRNLINHKNSMILYRLKRVTKKDKKTVDKEGTSKKESKNLQEEKSITASHSIKNSTSPSSNVMKTIGSHDPNSEKGHDSESQVPPPPSSEVKQDLRPTNNMLHVSQSTPEELGTKPEAPASEAHESKAPGSGAHESKAPGSGAHESKAPDSGAHESKAPDSGAHEFKASDSGAYEFKVPASGAHKRKATDSVAHKSKAPDSEASSSGAPDSLNVKGHEAEKVLWYTELPKLSIPDNKKDQYLHSVNPPFDFRENEDTLGSNLTAVYKVRFCPSLQQAVLLASGGESGLLRLDNLSPWLKRHCRDVFDELKQMEKSDRSKYSL